MWVLALRSFTWREKVQCKSVCEYVLFFVNFIELVTLSFSKAFDDRITLYGASVRYVVATYVHMCMCIATYSISLSPTVYKYQ